MSDADLLVFGCTVSFVALAGAYVYVRERYEAAARREGVSSSERPEASLHPVARPRRPGRATG